MYGHCALTIASLTAASTDFASQIEHTRGNIETCQFAGKSNCFVAVASFNSRRVEVPPTQRRGRLATVTHRIMQDNMNFYAPRACGVREKLPKLTGTASAWRCQASYQAMGQLMLYNIITTGKLSKRWGDLGCEAFCDGERVLGSCTELPLPEELTEATVAAPFCSAPIRMYHHSIRDGCCNQYQCLHAFLRAQVRPCQRTRAMV